ncbi:MAG: hypothetical protein COB15_16005 [Flavobacteriales bacterium]|nr:MAG: hypothetical protein COB15_16005 [Flavobacteriales bacterium]
MNKIFTIILILGTHLGIFAQELDVFIHGGDTCYILKDSLSFSDFHDYSEFTNSFPDGLWVQLTDEILEYKFHLKNNKLNGIWTSYDNQNKEYYKKGNYVDGFKTGPFYSYSESGQIFSIDYWADGSQQESYYYYKNGNLKKRFLHVSDTLDFHTYYYPNGFKKSEGLFSVKMNDKTGKIENWKSANWTTWFDNGVVESFGPYYRGKKNSAWDYFNKENEFVKSEYYKEGILIKSSTAGTYGEMGIIRGQYKK